MARLKKRYLTDENGRKTAVVLPIKEYEELLEDLEDLAIIAERKDEPTEPLDAVTERLEMKWKNIESR